MQLTKHAKYSLLLFLLLQIIIILQFDVILSHHVCSPLCHLFQQI